MSDDWYDGAIAGWQRAHMTQQPTASRGGCDEGAQVPYMPTTTKESAVSEANVVELGGDAWVCEDCYVAHHYGYQEVEDDQDYVTTASGFNPDADQLWWVGEGDRVTDCEPLGKLADCQLTDNTCSDHMGGTNVAPCPYCGGADDESGIDDFSMRACDGCGSHLGGSRHRLMVWDDAGWPVRHIDWHAAAKELSQDYTEVELGGVSYYARER